MDGKEMTELRELVEFLKANDVAEFDMEREDLKVRLKFAGAATGQSVDVAQIAQIMAASQAAAAAPAVVAHAHPAPPPAPTVHPSAERGTEVADGIADAHIVKSPIVGTFYDAPSPDAPTFVKVGDTVRNGQVLCIVEAMKLMNEIESDAAGDVVKVFVKSGQPVEYGQPLFAIK